MGAKGAWEARRELSDLEERLRFLAEDLDRAARAEAGHGLLVTTSVTDDPKYRELAALVDAKVSEVALLEEALGGVAYRVADPKLDDLKGKLGKLAKRAAKHGLGELTYRVTNEHDRVEHKKSGMVVAVDCFTFVVLSAPRLKLAGWAFLAKLSFEEVGVLVSKVPAFSRAWTMFREGHAESAPAAWGRSDAATEAAAAHLEELNLAKLAHPDVAHLCDHCGLNRRRTATYVVENLDTGELKRVGSNCLRDFLGVDPHGLARYAEYLWELEGELDDDEDGFGFGGGEKAETPVLAYVVHVCTMLRTVGWVARSAGGYATADSARENLYNFSKGRKGRMGEPLFEEPTDADIARAEAALAWARETLGERFHAAMEGRGAPMSDFDRNLYIAAAATVVTRKTEGLLAYVPVAHARALEREIEFAKRRESEAGSEYVGKVKDRLDLTLTVMSVFESEGHYGTTFITKLLDESTGNVFKWFGSYELDRGSTVTAKWTVKDHTEWKGVKETVITRPAKLVVSPAEPVAVAAD